MKLSLKLPINISVFSFIFTLLINVSSLMAQINLRVDTININGGTESISIPLKVCKQGKTEDEKTNAKNIETIKNAEAVIKKNLLDFVLERQNQKFISDNVVSEVKLDIIDEGGSPALRIVYSYSLMNDSVKFITDDFKLGEYKIEYSNAILVTLEVLKKSIEGQLSKYITPQKEVTITINGNADATPVRNKINYKGEYENQISENCDMGGSIQKITVSTATGINDNNTLAFIRSYAVRNYITQNIEPLKYTKNSFFHKSIVSEFSGGKFRRVSIEMIVHNAFENVTPD